MDGGVIVMVVGGDSVVWKGKKVDDDEIILHVLGEIASIFPRKIIRRVDCFSEQNQAKGGLHPTHPVWGLNPRPHD